MSSSSSDSFPPFKQDQIQINSKISSPPISKSSYGYPKTTSNHNLDNKLQENLQHLQRSSRRNTIDDATDKLLGKSEVADDDEGFRTPTSLDQIIPMIPTKCPPAPRKPRPPSAPPPRPCSRKRKLSRRRNLVMLDFSSEVESFFPTIIREDLRKKMKKSTKGDDNK